MAGVGLTGQGNNDLVFGLLNVFVVAPSFVAGGAWAYGLLGTRSAPPSP